MRKLYQNHTSQQLAEVVIQGMLEKKANNITVMDLRKIGTAVCDYYVICHGNSNTHVEAIAESVGYETRKHLSDKPIHVEGADVAEWILLDYVDVVVHVFQEKSRKFYNLEQLWADAEISSVKESMTN